MSASDETTALIGGDDNDRTSISRSPSLRLLPTAFLAALAIATTAATEIYAYAAILCKDPTKCQDEEINLYISTVFIAVTVANGVSLLSLGPLEELGRRSHRAGLLCWIVCRSMSVVFTLLGVSAGNITIALSGRIFEGLASDNLLHFVLNSIYVQDQKPRNVPYLVGLSLAAYMAAVCVGPLLGSVLPDFRLSFIVAFSLFAVNFFYVLLALSPGLSSAIVQTVSTEHHRDQSRRQICNFSTLTSPLGILRKYPLLLLPCVSLLCYNVVQSFVFVAVMTYTTVRFGFTGRQNGYIISLVHGIAAVYLTLSLYIWPRLVRSASRMKAPTPRSFNHGTDTSSGLGGVVSMSLEVASLTVFAFITESWQVYPAVALIAVGLSTPSFIKSFTATMVERADATAAMAGLAVFEMTGAVLAPIIVGTLMASRPGPTAFLFSAGCIFCAAVLLLPSICLSKRKAAS